MLDLEYKTAKLVNDVIKVKAKFRPYKAKGTRQRFYMQDAVDFAKEQFPDKEILSCNALTISNYGDNKEGEWEVKIKKSPPKSSKMSKSTKSEMKKEKVSVEKFTNSS